MKKRHGRVGRGLLNSVIDRLPVELHLPGYSYCGPGTKLSQRLSRGDPGINKLDRACKNHDIAYSQHSDTTSRSVADKELARQAWGRVKSLDASLPERAAALTVYAGMTAKNKLGMGVTRQRRRGRRQQQVKPSFRKGLMASRRALNDMPPTASTYQKALKALRAAKMVLRPGGGGRAIVPRVIPLPRQGGFLPALMALLPTLSAMGSIAGGAASVVKLISAVKSALGSKKRPQQQQSISMGNGLYLRPYRKGYGLFLGRGGKGKR